VVVGVAEAVNGLNTSSLSALICATKDCGVVNKFSVSWRRL
jgi:hypothetical protein